eukprot:6792667-Prymnesium_polylepis.1
MARITPDVAGVCVRGPQPHMVQAAALREVAPRHTRHRPLRIERCVTRAEESGAHSFFMPSRVDMRSEYCARVGKRQMGGGREGAASDGR